MKHGLGTLIETKHQSMECGNTYSPTQKPNDVFADLVNKDCDMIVIIFGDRRGITLVRVYGKEYSNQLYSLL